MHKKWYQHTWIWVVVGIFGFFCLLIGGTAHWYIGNYNELVVGQNNVGQYQSLVQNDLQRRSDVIENLVGAVKGSMGQERSVYGTIAKARTQYYNAKNKYKSSGSNAQAKANALNEQGSALNIMVGSIREAYPHLSSNGRVKDLMIEIERSNNRISTARYDLDRATVSYNDKLQTFPTNIVASSSNHHTIPQFNASSSAQQNPKVDLSQPNK